MSQDIFPNINPGSTSGTQLATLLNLFKDAVASGFIGESRPPNLQAGGYWIDSSLEGDPTYIWSFKIYDGVSSIEVFRINLQTGKVSIPGSEESFEIFRFTEDSAGPVLSFLKRRVGSNGQVVAEDTVGKTSYIGRTSTSGNPVVAEFEVEAMENMTSSAHGVALLWRAVAATTSALVEMMRLVNGRLGIGADSPTHTLHVKGTTGIKSEQEADDANGSSLVMEKARVAGSGAVQTNDVLGSHDWSAKDSTGAKSVVARIRAIAKQGHTDAAKGAELILSIVKLGQTALTEKIRFGDKITVAGDTILEALSLGYRTEATTSEITALATNKAFVIFTGSTETSLKGMDPAESHYVTIHNRSSARINIPDEDTGADAEMRFNNPDSLTISIGPRTSASFFYDVGASRWKSASGSGSGGRRIVRANIASLGEVGNLNSSLNLLASDQTIRLKSTTSAGMVTLSGVLFGTDNMSQMPNGARVTLIGQHADDFCKLVYADSTWGIVGPFESIELTRGKSVTFEKNDEEQRWFWVGGNNA